MIHQLSLEKGKYDLSIYNKFTNLLISILNIHLTYFYEDLLVTIQKGQTMLP